MEKHGISKAALAKIASVRPSAVTKWANGGSIRIAQLSKIAEYFGVDMRELMPHDDSPEVKKSESVSDVEFWKQRALDAEEKLLYAALRAEAAANGAKGHVLPGHAEAYANPNGAAYRKLNFREVLNAAGIGEGWTFHSWRHTFRSRLSEAGVDMETAKRLCGHTQDETSRHYDHAAHIEEYRSAIAAAAK